MYFNFLSQNSSQSVINWLVFYGFGLGTPNEPNIRPKPNNKKDRTIGIGRVFGRIFGFGLGRYRYFPITKGDCRGPLRAREGDCRAPSRLGKGIGRSG